MNGHSAKKIAIKAAKEKYNQLTDKVRDVWSEGDDLVFFWDGCKYRDLRDGHSVMRDLQHKVLRKMLEGKGASQELRVTYPPPHWGRAKSGRSVVLAFRGITVADVVYAFSSILEAVHENSGKRCSGCGSPVNNHEHLQPLSAPV